MTGSAKQSSATADWIASSQVLLAMTENAERRFFHVIASQRVGAKRRPMTGSAKQSMMQRNEYAYVVGKWIASRSLVIGGAFAPTRWLAMTWKKRRYAFSVIARSTCDEQSSLRCTGLFASRHRPAKPDPLGRMTRKKRSSVVRHCEARRAVNYFDVGDLSTWTRTAPAPANPSVMARRHF